MEHFKKLASGLLVGDLLRGLILQPELWKQVTDRQDYAGSAHKDTETVFLRWCPGRTIESAFTEIEAVDYPAAAALPGAEGLVNFALMEAGAEKLGRVIVARLRPGGFITPHVDEGAYADHYERFHISLESESGNTFMVGDDQTDCGEFVHMRPGELWWFNHKMTHWVANRSERPRTHLIIDAVAPRYRRERALR